MLRPFRLLRPTTIPEASAELARLGDQAKVYAAGAELLLLMRHGIAQPDYLVDIKRIPGLDQLTWDGRVMSIGATVTHRRLETDPLVCQHLPMFATAESKIGNIRIRNQGTLGGNLCFNDPHADSPTPLLVHEASATIGGRNGEREVGMTDFLVGTYATALEPDEILTGVKVPPLPAGWGSAYLRVERYYRPTLNVAAAVKAADDRIEDVRVAVGCVGPIALRLSELEAQVRGLTVAEARRVAAESKPYLTELLEPVDDHLGSADYKIQITSVLVGRALAQAAQGNGGGPHA